MIGIENRPTGEVLPWGIWVPNGSPVLPERRLLVPEPAIKFDKLTPAQMGEAHGRIAERPPFEIVDRLRGLRFFPDMGLYQRDKKLAIEGQEYASAYAQNIGIWLNKRGAADEDVDRFNQVLLGEAEQLIAYIHGMERISNGHNRFYYPEGYALGFAVGVAKDFNLPVSFTGVPTNTYEYNAFLDGLAGVEVPRDFGSLAGRIPQLRAFQLGNRIHEIVEAEPAG